MSLFEVMKVDEEYWGVYVVNPNDPGDKILVSTSICDDRSPMDRLAGELNRIAAIKKTEPLLAPTPTLPSGDIEERIIRAISFED